MIDPGNPVDPFLDQRREVLETAGPRRGQEATLPQRHLESASQIQGVPEQRLSHPRVHQSRADENLKTALSGRRGVRHSQPPGNGIEE